MYFVSRAIAKTVSVVLARREGRENEVLKLNDNDLALLQWNFSCGLPTVWLNIIFWECHLSESGNVSFLLIWTHVTTSSTCPTVIRSRFYLIDTTKEASSPDSTWDGDSLRNVVFLSGFGGLEVACWPLVPKFAGSNPAEAVGFFRAKKSSARLPSEGK